MRRAVVLTLMVAVVLMPTETVADEPRIVQPDNQAGVVEGDRLPVRGAGCPGGSIVSFEFNGEPLPAATTADRRGRFAAAITVPDVAVEEEHPEAGESVLAVSCGGSRTIVILVVSERPPPPSPTREGDCPPTTIVVRPEQGPPGTTVTIAGAGWSACEVTGGGGTSTPRAGEPLQGITLGFSQGVKGTVLATIDARPDSTFEIQVRIPRPAEPGAAMLQARFPPAVAAEDPFTVTAPPPQPKALADTGVSVATFLAALALFVAAGTGLLCCATSVTGRLSLPPSLLE